MSQQKTLLVGEVGFHRINKTCAALFILSSLNLKAELIKPAIHVNYHINSQHVINIYRDLALEWAKAVWLVGSTSDSLFF
jgi:hypothetical protein